MYCTVLYCTVLYCIVLYCTVVYCSVLYCTVLYCMYCTVLYRDGYFGPVCDDDWDYHDAGVVCRCIHLFCDSVIFIFVNIIIHSY